MRASPLSCCRLGTQTCDRKDYYIQMPLSNDMLRAMGEGQADDGELPEPQQARHHHPLPLNGFMVAYQKIQ